MRNPVIEATKAILFEDCGSSQEWEHNLNLGEAAIKELSRSDFPTMDAERWAELYRLRAECFRHEDQMPWHDVAARTRADLAAAQQEIARLRAALADVVRAYRNPHNAALDVNVAINRAAQEI